MMSADMNIDHGDNSRMPAAGFESLLSPSAGAAPTTAGVAGDATDGAPAEGAGT
jgi:hypothetical protein